jgi:hypothetical protein
MKREAEQNKLQPMGKVHNVFEMWQGSQILCAAENKIRAQNKPMTTVGYISDTEEVIKESWSNIQHDSAATFKLSERSHVPTALSAKNLLGR